MSDTGFKTFVDASQKFDYFTTGAAGAALSYVVQSYARSPGDQWWLLVDVAMGSLLIAFSSGLFYLSNTVEALRMGHELEVAQVRLADLREAVRKNAGAYIPGLDKEFAPHEIQYAIDAQTRQLEDMRKVLAPLASRRRRSQGTRNVFLAAGLGLLTLWKILQGT